MELPSKEVEKKITGKEKKEILAKIEKASSEEYVTEWNKDGRIVYQKKKSEMKKGRKSRASGANFELKVRKDLEEKNWTVAKYPNNFDLTENKIIPAKRKFNPFSKIMTIGTGFPDFVAFQKMNEYYNVIGVEVKVNGQLSKEEKEKCRRLLERNIFSDILIAKKKIQEKKHPVIEYTSFKEKYIKKKI